MWLEDGGLSPFDQVLAGAIPGILGALLHAIIILIFTGFFLWVIIGSSEPIARSVSSLVSLAVIFFAASFASSILLGTEVFALNVRFLGIGFLTVISVFFVVLGLMFMLAPKNTTDSEGGSLRDKELAVRSDFDGWLADECLRLEIACVNQKEGSTDRARLKAVNDEKQKNLERMAGLSDGTLSGSAYEEAGVVKRWDALRLTSKSVADTSMPKREAIIPEPKPLPAQPCREEASPEKGDASSGIAQRRGDGSFVTSAVVGYVTDSAILGGLAGGSFAGGLAGSGLNSRSGESGSESGPDCGDSDSSSYDSSSYGGDSGGDCGGD